MTIVDTVTPILTTHPGPWAGGYGWYPFLPFVGFFFFFFVLVLLVVFGVLGRRRAWGGPPHRDAVRSAEADLARRFASGEIDDKEYESRLGTLRRLGGS